MKKRSPSPQIGLLDGAVDAHDKREAVLVVKRQRDAGRKGGRAKRPQVQPALHDRPSLRVANLARAQLVQERAAHVSRAADAARIGGREVGAGPQLELAERARAHVSCERADNVRVVPVVPAAARRGECRPAAGEGKLDLGERAGDLAGGAVLHETVCGAEALGCGLDHLALAERGGIEQM